MARLKVEQRTALKEAVIQKAKVNALVRRTIEMNPGWAEWPVEDLRYLAAVNSDPISTIEQQDTITVSQPETSMLKTVAGAITGAASAVADAVVPPVSHYSREAFEAFMAPPEALGRAMRRGIDYAVLDPAARIGDRLAEREFAAAERMAQEEEDNAELDGAAVDEIMDMQTPGAVTGGSNVFLDAPAALANGIVSAVDAVVDGIDDLVGEGAGGADQEPETIARIQAEVDAEREAERQVHANAKLRTQVILQSMLERNGINLQGVDDLALWHAEDIINVFGLLQQTTLTPATATDDPQWRDLAKNATGNAPWAIRDWLDLREQTVDGSGVPTVFGRLIDAQRRNVSVVSNIPVVSDAAKAVVNVASAVADAVIPPKSLQTRVRYVESIPIANNKSVVQQAAELPVKAASAVVDAAVPAPAKENQARLDQLDVIIREGLEGRDDAGITKMSPSVLPDFRAQNAAYAASLKTSTPVLANLAAKVTGDTMPGTNIPVAKWKRADRMVNANQAALKEAELIADRFYRDNPAGDTADRRRRAKRTTTSLVKYAGNPAALDFRGSRSKR